MTISEFNEIPDFAVAREWAVAFTGICKGSRFRGIKMPQDLEAMELGHIAVIEGIRRDGVLKPTSQGAKPEDQRIPLCRCGQPLTLSYQNILIRGMKREEALQALYRTGASLAIRLATLFRKLASDEAKHKLFLKSSTTSGSAPK